MTRALMGADISREGWEALWEGEGDPPRISDARLEIENIFERLRIHGRLVAEHPEVAEELRVSMAQAIARLPTWLTAKVYGATEMDAEALIRDFAELVRTHREAIVRVVGEQAADQREIKAVLDQAPVHDLDDDNLAEAVGRVSSAHSQALILVARDTDAWLEMI